MYSYDDDNVTSHFTNRVYMPRVRGNIIGVLTVKTEIILWRKEGRNLYPLTRLPGTFYWIHCSSCTVGAILVAALEDISKCMQYQ